MPRPGTQKPGSNVNHFGGSVGGPILQNKLFFFFDTEWVRIALADCDARDCPDDRIRELRFAAASGGRDRLGDRIKLSRGAAVGAVLSEDVFALRKYRAGRHSPCWVVPSMRAAARAAGSPPDGNLCANRQSVSHSSDDHEQVQTVRIDYNMNPNNTAWLRFQADTGLQAAYTDPINPIFDALSPQPLYSVVAGYTHIFSQSLVNYFNPGFSWYSSLFAPRDLQETLAAFPIVLQGSGANAPFTTIGGLDNTWLQGRRASRVFLNDNLAWTHGAHELRFGTNTRSLLLNDYDFDEGYRAHGDVHGFAPVHPRSGLDRDGDFPANAGQRAFRLSEPGPICARYVEGDAQEYYLDVRTPRFAEFQSTQPT